VYLKCTISGKSIGLAEEKHKVWLAPVQQPAQTEVVNVVQSVETHMLQNLTEVKRSAGFTKCHTNMATPINSSTPLQKKKERLPSIEDKPTMEELMYFKTRSGSINILEEIGTHYNTLGIFLLQDSNGTVTKAIRAQYQLDATLITQEILQRWLDGRGMKPIEWSTLISVLKKIQLSTLAQDIANNLQ
jgi:hypothetical protein